MPRKKGIKCDAVTYDKTLKIVKPCIFEQKPNESGEMTLYCNCHQYWLNFTEEIINGIKNSTNDYHTCGRCKIWHNGKNDNCCKCLSNTKQHSLKEKESKLDLKCIFIVKDTENDKGHQCQYCKINNTQYCEKHERFKDYTQEMMENLKFCSTCRCQDYFVGFKTCDKCRGVAKKLRKKVSLQKQTLPKCVKCDKAAYQNGYCGKHQLDAWIKEVETEGLKPCFDCVRGCRSKLEISYPYSKCENCLEKCREKDKQLREKTIELCKIYNCKSKELVSEIESINRLELKLNYLFENQITFNDLMFIINKYGTDEYIEKFNIEYYAYKFHLEQIYEEKEEHEFLEFIKIFDSVEQGIIEMSQKHMIENAIQLLQEIKNDLKVRLENNTMLCINCMHESNVDQFKDSYGKETKWCKTCREKMNKIDENREKRIREYKLYEQTEKRKKQKKIWNNENYEKIIEYQMKYKSKLMEKYGDDYWNDRAKIAKKWRENNPEKQEKFNLERNSSVKYTLDYYKRRAHNNHIKWNITDEYALQLLKSNCKYCGEIDKYDISGIDRVNNNLGYTQENTVSCCKICNFMKGIMSLDVYLNKIKHILSCMMISNEVFSKPRLFGNHCSASYEKYMKRAIKEKQVEFELSEDEFQKLKRLDCYMCMKESTLKNLNGIDCIDNTVGYTLDNCMPCCYDCNKIKNEYDIYDVIRKMFKTIYPQYDIEHIKPTLNSYIKIILKKNIDLINSNDTNLLKKLETINEYSVAKYKSTEKKKKMYGENNYKRLNALREQKSKATKKNDIITIKNIEAEIEQIQNNPEIEHIKIKLTKEEKTKRKTEQKRLQREKRRLQIGDEEYRKEMSLNKKNQKEKQKLKQELQNKN